MLVQAVYLLNAQLRGGHHGAQKTLRRCLCQFSIGRECGEYDTRKPFRSDHGRQRFLISFSICLMYCCMVMGLPFPFDTALFAGRPLDCFI